MQPPSRLVLGPLPGGLQTYDKAFFQNNDTFPVINNALCWRHSIIKKPGSQFLGQLRRSLDNVAAPTATFTTTIPEMATSYAAGNFQFYGSSQFIVGNIIYTDSNLDTTSAVSILNATPSTGTAGSELNRQTGVLTLNFPAVGSNTDIIFVPGIPEMGIEEFESSQSATAPIDTPTNVYFDTAYSYLFDSTSGLFVDNSFYVSTAEFVSWSGQNYQQFGSCNYYRAMFCTNNVPGYHFAAVHSCANQASNTITMVIYNKPGGSALTTLVDNDLLFFNEGAGTTWTLNGQTGKITDATGSATGTYVISFSTSQTVNTYTADSSIAQLLTTSVNGSGDGIRWYDGTGFSNFCPPLDNTATPLYLVGARILIPFGNRLLAIGSFEATSAQIFSTPPKNLYYGNRIRYCEVTATPFYANAPVYLNSTTSVGSEPNAWVSNIQGFGGFIDLDTTQRIVSAAITQSSLILGIEAEQRKVTLTGIETDPFTLQVINPDYGTAGTHSIIPMDKGILTAGEYGFITTSSYDAKRFDLPIIDQIFQVDPSNNGYERISGGRDFVKEVIYFSYPSVTSAEGTSSSANEFPDTTLVYNYREGSFATWTESVTTYGLIKTTPIGTTWSSLTYLTWEEWNDPWNSGPASVSNYPYVGFGTPQGYVMLKWATETTNGPSLNIQSITGPNVTDGTYSIISKNHNLFPGLYVGFFAPSGGSTPYIPGASPSFIGQVAYLGDSSRNNPDSIFAVNFDSSIDPSVIVAGTWKVSIVDRPFVQTKQFQSGWSDARKTRIGAQKYFLDRTDSGEFTAQILGSQSPDPLNDNVTIEPSLISNAIVRTRPDNDLGINSNQSAREQIWHRLASSCIGDTVQLQLTLSDAQMRDVAITSSTWVLYSIILDLYPSRTLA